MELNLIPLCDLYDHKMEDTDSNYLLLNSIKCDICNINISYYRCENCEHVTCLDCQRGIINENNKIIKDMKNILCDKITKIQDEVGEKHEVIFYKKTGNIYIHDPEKKTTRRYLHEKSRFFRCLDNIF